MNPVITFERRDPLGACLAGMVPSVVLPACPPQELSLAVSVTCRRAVVHLQDTVEAPEGEQQRVGAAHAECNVYGSSRCQSTCNSSPSEQGQPDTLMQPEPW